MRQKFFTSYALHIWNRLKSLTVDAESPLLRIGLQLTMSYPLKTGTAFLLKNPKPTFLGYTTLQANYIALSEAPFESCQRYGFYMEVRPTIS